MSWSLAPSVFCLVFGCSSSCLSSLSLRSSPRFFSCLVCHGVALLLCTLNFRFDVDLLSNILVEMAINTFTLTLFLYAGQWIRVTFNEIFDAAPALRTVAG